MGDVSYTARFTRNMGNYESLQLEIGVVDQPRNDETHADAYERVKAFVASRLLKEVEELEKDINQTREAVKSGNA